MAALLLILNTVLHQAEAMTVKKYGRKHGDGGMFFNAVTCLFATVFFVVTDQDGLVFLPEIIAFGFVGCLMFATGFYTMYVALQCGTFAATKLVSTFSGVLPIVYGIAILKEPTSAFFYIGIILTFVSLFLMNYNGKIEKKKTKGACVKWVVSVFLTLVSNGFIAIIQKMQQNYFNKAFDNEFMILSLGGASIVLFVVGAIVERTELKTVFKSGALYGALAGFFNGAGNFVNLLIYLYVPISLMSPLKTGLNIVTSFAISVFVYRDKFTLQQTASVAVGCVAILMFNAEKIAGFFIR